MANYVMSNKDMLGLTMLLEPDVWRAHAKQILHYEDCARCMVPGLRIQTWDIFLTPGGLSILMANDIRDKEAHVAWKWTDFEPYLQIVLQATIPGDMSFVQYL